MVSDKRNDVPHLYGYRVARVFRALTDRAEAGRVVSSAVMVVTDDGQVEYRLTGAYERRPKEATHDLLKFLEALLGAEE